MNTPNDGKNGIEKFAVIVGGQSAIRGRRRGRRPGPRVLTPAERELDRQMHGAFVVLKTPDGTTPTRGVAVVNAMEAHPWRTMGVRVLEAIEHRCAPARVRALGTTFLDWIDRQLDAAKGTTEHNRRDWAA